MSEQLNVIIWMVLVSFVSHDKAEEGKVQPYS